MSVTFFDAEPQLLGSTVLLAFQFEDDEGVRIIRKTDENFAGPDDPDADLVYEGQQYGLVLDTPLDNGTTYYYRCYPYTMDNDNYVWGSPAEANATPAPLVSGEIWNLEAYAARWLERVLSTIATEVDGEQKYLNVSVRKSYPAGLPPVLPVIVVSNGEGRDVEGTAGDELSFTSAQTEEGEPVSLETVTLVHRRFTETLDFEILCSNSDQRHLLFRILRAALLGLGRVLSVRPGLENQRLQWGPDVDINVGSMEVPRLMYTKTVTMSFEFDSMLHRSDTNPVAQAVFRVLHE